MKVIKYHSAEGQRVALLVSTGHKLHKIIQMDNPIRVTKVPISEDRYFTELDYPPAKAKRKFKAAVKRFHGSIRNISKEAREALA